MNRVGSNTTKIIMLIGKVMIASPIIADELKNGFRLIIGLLLPMQHCKTLPIKKDEKYKAMKKTNKNSINICHAQSFAVSPRSLSQPRVNTDVFCLKC